MPDEVIGKVFQENQMGDHKLAYDEHITKFNFLVTFNLKRVLWVNGEYTKQRKKL